MIEILGLNNYLGVNQKGLAKNISTLKFVNPQLKLIELHEIIKEEVQNPKLKNFESVLATNELLARACLNIFKESHIPLCILGDHSASIGSVSAASSMTDNLGVLWVDAHADINTPQTSPSGNIHGMINASLLNLFDSPLSHLVFQGQKIKPENLAMIGLRDVDPGEQQFIKDLKIEVYPYQDVIQQGLPVILEKLTKKFSKVDKLHLSIDMDSMDPKLVSGVSVPVSDGFTPDDISLIIKTLCHQVPISSIDIVEYNPDFDTNYKSAKVLLGFIKLIKKIL